MTTPRVKTSFSDLPITGKLTPVYISSLTIALLMSGVSVTGILYQSVIYPTDELLQTFLANDVANLAIGLPILLLSMWWTWRGKLVGLLFWPGALFYVMYTYVVYVLAMPISAVFLFYLTLLTLSLYTLIGLVGLIDGAMVKQRLTGAVAERLGGGILAALGAIFVLRVVGVIVQELIYKTPVSTSETALLITDFTTSPAWIIGGMMLWQRKAFGYVVGLGLLFQGSMLFVGLIIILVLQPILTNTPFAALDLIVVFVMGLVFFIPFALFARGTLAERKATSG